jgi:FkbM family methyltransferase
MAPPSKIAATVAGGWIFRKRNNNLRKNQLDSQQWDSLMINEKLIYDVGAHKGEDTEFYLKKGFAVVAIEAAPELYARLKEKFAEFVQSGQLTLNLAVSKTAGPIDFYIDEKMSVWGTANPDWAARNKYLGGGNTRKISINARSLADIMKEHGIPHYCKIDIEGNDLDALESLAGSAETPAFVSLESEKRDWGRLMKEFLTFRALGYTRFKAVDQTLIKFQTCPQPPREGEYCDHAFQDGSSGLFGEELPGTWLSFPEAIEAYRRIFTDYALNGDNGLFRRHAGIFSVFYTFARLQRKIARLKNFSSYGNPADILPPAAWYDTHAGR